MGPEFRHGWLQCFVLACLVSFVAGTCVVARAGDDDPYPRFSLTQSGEFVRLAALPTEEVARLFEIPVRIFKNAKDSCSVRKLRKRIKEAQATERMETALAQFTPEWRKSLLQNNVIVLFDDLSFVRDRHRMYYHRFSGINRTIIWVDCVSSQLDSVEFAAGLAHEFAHVLLLDREIPTWFNEGIAQVVEAEAGGAVPSRMVNALARSPSLPALFANQTVHTEKLYALSYLFAQFIHSAFGGWSPINNLVSSTPSNDMSYVEFIEARLSAGRYKNTLAERFLMALLEPETNILSGWPGFSNVTPTAPSRGATIAPGQIARLRPTEGLSINNALIQKDVKSETWVINPTDHELPILPDR